MSTQPTSTASHPAPRGPVKDMKIAYLLWFFLGGLGVHRFYLDRTGSAIALLSLTVVSALLTVLLIGVVGLVIVGAWVLLDAFLIPGMTRRANGQPA